MDKNMGSVAFALKNTKSQNLRLLSLTGPEQRGIGKIFFYSILFILHCNLTISSRYVLQVGNNPQI